MRIYTIALLVCFLFPGTAMAQAKLWFSFSGESKGAYILGWTGGHLSSCYASGAGAASAGLSEKEILSILDYCKKANFSLGIDLSEISQMMDSIYELSKYASVEPQYALQAISASMKRPPVGELSIKNVIQTLDEFLQAGK